MQITPSAEPPDPAVEEYLAARAAADQAQERLKYAQQGLIEKMQHDQRKSYKWLEGDKARSLTYVSKTTAVVDEAGLRKALTAKIFDRYTKKVLDKRAMEKAMDAGELDPVTISKYVTTRQSAPYLTYTEREAPQ